MKQEQLSYSDYIFSAGTFVENELYFFSEKENVLMKATTGNWKIEYVDKFSEYNFDMYGRTETLKSIGKVIYRLPQKGGNIDIYSLDNGVYKKIKVKKYNKDWDNFIAFEVKGDFIYIFPKWEKEVLKIDTLSGKLATISLTDQNDNRNIYKKFGNFSASYREEDLIWLFEEGNHRICIYSMADDSFFYRIVPEMIDTCTCFCKKDKLVYFLTAYNCVFAWNIWTNECHQLWSAEDYRSAKYYLGQIVAVPGKIIALPGLGYNIIIIDCADGTSVLYDKYPDNFTYLDIKWSKYINSFEDADYYYYPMRLSGYLMAIDKKTGEITWNEVMVPSWNERTHYVQMKVNSLSSILNENQVRIDAFLSILKVKSEKRGAKDLKKTLGNMIWEKMKYY